MIGRIIEIQENGRHLSLYRGFLMVKADDTEIARIPLDDIAVLIANAYQLSYSHNLLIELTKRGITFITCGDNHLPAAILWPIDSHHQQAGIMNAQVEAGKPLKKQIWKQLIQAKICFQHEVISKANLKSEALLAMAQRVRSGDPDNIEAQAARRYWPLLMGKGFSRDRSAEGINSLLNFGYAIIRSGVARAIMASGLHPTFGIHHRSRINPMCLVDDVMEPFRPCIDWKVYSMVKEGIKGITPESKKILALTLSQDCTFNKETTPISVAIFRVAQSLTQCFQENNPKLLTLPDVLLTSPAQLPLPEID